MLIPNITVTHISLVNNYTGTKPTFSSQIRQTHMFGYQFSGHYSHKVENGELEFTAGSVFFIHAKDAYTVKTRQIGTSICFCFTCAEALDIPSFVVDCTGQTQLPALFEKAHIDWLCHSAQHRSVAFANLYNAIVRFNGFYDKKYLSSGTRERLDKVVSYIYANLDKSLTLPQLSQIAGVSDRRLRTIFQETYRMSPQQYIMKARMQTACGYIKTDLYSLQEVAELVGFEDIYYFNRCFKKQIGASPRQYQKLHRQEVRSNG